MTSLTELFKRVRGDGPVNQLARAVADTNARLARVEKLTADAVKAARAAQEAAQAIVSPAKFIHGTDPEPWKEVAQEGELAFHKRPNMRSSDTWADDVARDWKELGFEADAWAGKLIVDVGAGSRLRTLYFRDAKIAALEPLADRFASEVEWQDIDQADEMYAVPVEQLVPELVGRGDLIVSINALDHGYNFEAGIRNIRKYAKPDATVFLSFDQHNKPDNMHPLVLNERIVREIFEQNGFEIVKTSPRRRYHGAVGPGALNFWLRPVEVPATVDQPVAAG